jgi:hypothetical protein
MARKLKIKTLKRKQWCDADIVLLHASFQILKDCVEKEDLFNHSDSYAQSGSGKTAKELYDWWEIRSKKEDSLDDEQYEKDTIQLVKLMTIRGGLWT